MKRTAKIINLMQEQIIQARPTLAYLKTDKSVMDYLRPALEWSMQNENFPYAELLRKHIVLEVQRLYGNASAKIAHKQLGEGWVIETGAHLHIPRKYDKAGSTGGQQINAAYFQGQVFWAFANQTLGRKLNISLSTGKVPLDNINSGAYLDLPSFKTPVTLASKKRHPDSPQTLIPATSKEEILKKIEQVQMLKRQKLLPDNEYELALLVLTNFLHQQSTFSDQVATTHALMMDKILPVKQITLDSEKIGIEFIANLLEDKTSLTHTIFADSQLREKFITSFAGILKGWPVGSTPFYRVIQKEEGYSLVNYDGNLEPKVLAKGLREKTIFPSVIMKFFCLMVEAGICPNGAWTQAVYCTQIKDRAIKLLTELGLTKRALVLQTMPTEVAAVSACFGMQEFKGEYELLDSISVLLDPYAYDIKPKLNISGEQAFLLITPFLYEYLMKEPALLSYTQLKDFLKFALFANNSSSANFPFPYIIRYN